MYKRQFVSKPRVIFADEPTGNLDSITSKQVLYRMLQISKQMGTTFVMVTHAPELASCADRIITILDGKVQSDVVQDPATRAVSSTHLDVYKRQGPWGLFPGTVPRIR